MKTFEQQLRIDLHHLEVELEASPSLYYEAAKAVDSAQAEVREIEEGLKLCKAELSAEFRTGCEKSGTKFTDSSIDTFVRNHPRHQKLKTDWLKAMAKADSARSMMFSVHKRDANLKEAINLWCRGYFHAPGTPHQLDEIRAKHFQATSAFHEAVEQEIINALGIPGELNQESSPAVTIPARPSLAGTIPPGIFPTLDEFNSRRRRPIPTEAST
jgi:hypothetical protein